MDSFPPNSNKAKATAREPKKVERVTSADGAVRRKKPLGRQVKETFISGDARTAVSYVVATVIIPSAKDILVEAVTGAFERFVYGDRVRGGRPSPTSSVLGHVAYNRVPPSPQGRQAGPPQISRQSRARHSFGEIVIASRGEAEEVIDRLFDIIDRYGEASVADLYTLTGMKAEHTDQKWGWTGLRGASVGRIRTGGYLLNLPEPEALG